MGNKKMKKIGLLLLVLLFASASFLALKHHYHKHRAVSVMLQGRNIYQFILSSGDRDYPSPDLFPKTTGSKVFETSTDYFRDMVASDHTKVNVNFFAAPGIKPADSVSSFSSSNNAWCIVADVSSNHPASTPVLITRNIMIDSLDQTPKWKDDSPLDLEYAVIVTLGGDGFTVAKSSASELFADLGMSNKVMRP